MYVLAHRGSWVVEAERNTLPAFCDAFERGWGVELDVRDCDGRLVISHDPPAAGALELSAVLDAFEQAGCPGTLAINVKADGLETMTAALLRHIDPAHWFAFDMSVPDMLRYAQAGLPYFTRHSNIEDSPALYADAAGVWLDDFAGGFITEQLVSRHVQAGKRVAIVSPELHGRDHTPMWDRWRRWPVWSSPDVLLCTDHPHQAQEVLR